MKKSFIALCFVFAGMQLKAQNTDKIITRDYVDKLIKTLSSDEMQGRGTFTPGIEKAATFIEGEFKKIGLNTQNGLTSYKQTFYKYQSKPVSKEVKIDGKVIDASNILVAGNVTEGLEFSQNDAAWLKLDTEKPFIDQYRTLLRSGKKQLVLVDVKFVDVFKRLKAFSERGSLLDEKDLTASPVATVFVLGEDTVKKDFTVRLKNELTKLSLANVVGVIPGKSKPDEMVVFSGHYDHLGIIKAVEQDSIANGADDDASGTTAVIALAKYYKKLNNNARTLVFVAFTAEEIGGFGSKYFSQQLDPDKVTAMFNIEMIGKESKFGKNAAFITGYERSDFGKILQKNLEGTEFSFHPDPYPEQNLFYRSDNATLAALGVPAHTISTDQIDSDKFYHTVKDEYETLNVDNIVSTIRAIAKSAISIVNGTDMPSRIPKLKQ